MMNFTSAIYTLYPQVVRTVGDDAFDIDGNPVVYDQAAVEHQAAMMTLRANRNQLLTETDYLALADSTLTDEMRDYRQALRDLPANTVDPANPVWPVKPGGN
jgi:hypothetical protein